MQQFCAYFPSPLGILKIVCSGDAVNEIIFTEESEVVQKGFENIVTSLAVKQLDEYFKGERKVFELPLAQKGTVFQQKVWDLLVQIPFGKTISYQQLSKQYGDAKAIRAVAAANGKNNLAIVIPCHRVIGSNQSLTGYAGGLWRKKWLLQHEAKFHSGVQQLF